MFTPRRGGEHMNLIKKKRSMKKKHKKKHSMKKKDKNKHSNKKKTKRKY